MTMPLDDGKKYAFRAFRFEADEQQPEWLPWSNELEALALGLGVDYDEMFAALLPEKGTKSGTVREVSFRGHTIRVWHRYGLRSSRTILEMTAQVIG